MNKYNSENTNRTIHLGKYNSGKIIQTHQKKQSKIQIGKVQTDKTVRTNTYRQIQIKKHKQVGKYTSAKVNRGTTSRKHKSKQYCKMPSGRHQSEHNNSVHTNRKVHIGKIQFGKYQSNKFKSDKYTSGNTNSKHTNQKIQFGNTNRTNAILKKLGHGKYKPEIQIKNYKPEKTTRQIQYGKYKPVN